MSSLGGMMIVEVLLGVIAFLVLLPAVVLFLQVLRALSFTESKAGFAHQRPKVAILVPAHDEAAVIADTLAALMPQLAEGDRVLVVADNCSDDTAALARAAGAEVVERVHATLRGKGFALDYGMRHLEAAPPEVLLIVDADCHVEPGAVERLARTCAATGRPLQALDLMRAPAGAGLKMRVAEFAWRVKNWVRPLGWLRLGLPCQLMGTGMAFPWAVAARMELANASIVEDMKLGLDLAREGYPPLFCPEAVVTSWFPTGEAAAKSQRTRWEHGHLGLILREAPRLLGRAVGRGDGRLGGLALDLLVPPLALLVLLLVGLVAMTGVAVWLGFSAVPLVLALAGLGAVALAVLLAWAGWGRDVVSLTDLLSVPFYVLAKVPVYLAFWTRRQKEWVRTDRE